MSNVQKKSGDVEVRRNPLTESEDFDYFDRLFNSFMTRGWPAWMERHRVLPGLTGMKVPKVDIVDNEDKILVRAELPGVDKNDLDVSVTENTVTIKGVSGRKEEKEEGDYYRCEIEKGEFRRMLQLPAETDADKATATFENGVLELTIPKIEPPKPKTIEIH